jgi:hypothetical protein
MGFSFVTVVSFVFEKRFHVKNGRAKIDYPAEYFLDAYRDAR